MSEIMTLFWMMVVMVGAVLTIFSPMIYKQWKTSREATPPDEALDRAFKSGPSENDKKIARHQIEFANRRDDPVVRLTWREIASVMGYNPMDLVGVSDIIWKDGDPIVKIGFRVRYSYPDPLLGVALLHDYATVYEDWPVHEIDNLIDREAIRFKFDGHELKIVTLDIYEAEEYEDFDGSTIREEMVRVWDDDKQRFHLDREKTRIYEDWDPTSKTPPNLEE